MQRKFKRIKNGMVWGGLLGFIDKIYLIMSVCTILSLRLTLDGKIEMTADFWISVGFGVIMVLYPLVVTCIIACDKSKLTKKKYMRMYGYVYKDL